MMPETQLRIPPHSAESEKGVLGSILLAPVENMGIHLIEAMPAPRLFYIAYTPLSVAMIIPLSGVALKFALPA